MPKKGSRRPTATLKADSLAVVNAITPLIERLAVWHPASLHLNAAAMFVSQFRSELDAMQVEAPAAGEVGS